MIKKIILLVVCFLTNGFIHLWCQGNSYDASNLAHFFSLASKSFIFNSAIPEDSIIDLANQLEVENKKIDNVRFAWFAGGCGIILLGSIVLVCIVRQKNQKLLLSHHKLMTTREETIRSVYSKSVLLSNMSHELRTPLNAIVGFSSLLSNSEAINADTKKQCGESIRQNAGLLQKLIKDVMDFSELNIGEMSYTCEMHNAVNICRLVVDTVENVKQTAAEIKFTTSRERIDLYTDSGRLQQVLINLLINSTKFTKSGTISLSLQVDETKNEAIFTIEDTGCGIPPEQQAHIFGRFEKLHEGVQGSGLGLSICFHPLIYPPYEKMDLYKQHSPLLLASVFRSTGELFTSRASINRQ